MLDQQLVTLVPITGPVQVQGFLVSVCVMAGSGGLGLVDPLLWDQQPLGQEALPADRLIRLLQGAVQGQHVSDGLLPLAEDTQKQNGDSELRSAAGTSSALIRNGSIRFVYHDWGCSSVAEVERRQPFLKETNAT